MMTKWYALLWTSIALTALAARAQVPTTAPTSQPEVVTLAVADPDTPAGRWTRLAARAAAVLQMHQQLDALVVADDTTLAERFDEERFTRRAVLAWLLGRPVEFFSGQSSTTAELTLPAEQVRVGLERLWHRSQPDQPLFTDFSAQNPAPQYAASGTVASGGPLVPPATVPPRQAGRNDTLPARWEAIDPAGVRVAMLSARRDGMRRLGEAFRQIAITPSLSVGDLIAKSASPSADPASFLRGAQPSGYRFHGEVLIVECDMTAQRRAAMTIFKSWADQYCRTHPDDLRAVQAYVETIGNETIEQTGLGTPPARYLGDLSAGHRERLELLAGPDAPLWATGQRVYTGSAAMKSAAEANDAALAQLAIIDARQAMIAAVEALDIVDGLTVRDYFDESDATRIWLVAVLASARPDQAGSYTLAGQVHRRVRLNLLPLWRAVIDLSARRPLRPIPKPLPTSQPAAATQPTTLEAKP
jgi:hypothetical protein